MRRLYKNIKQLIQVRSAEVSLVSGKDMKVLPCIENAYLVTVGDLIADFGTMDECPDDGYDEALDCAGRMILPTWCDSHTHIVYAGDRSGEFVDRINGLSYQEIAQKGGGILNSAKHLCETSESTLYAQSAIRLKQIMKMGTGAVEIKSGYGLNIEGELKMLRVIDELKKNNDILIKSTFLGAHAIPQDFKGNSSGYIQLLINDLLPQINKKGLADYIDIFCEEGYFSVEDMIQLLHAAKAYNLRGKVHVNQFNAIGGVTAAVNCDVLSVDHLEVMRPEDIRALKGSKTMPVALPACSYFLSIPYTPARDIIDAGLPLAIASDYNPGSSPSGNMNFVVSTACIKMKMTPEEAINAATINGAYAMGLEDQVGSITVGKKANFILTKKIESYNTIPYSFGRDSIDIVYISGKELV